MAEGNITCITLRKKADSFLADGKLIEAQETLLQIYKLNRHDSGLLIEIGDICLKLNNKLGAKHYYGKADKMLGTKRGYTLFSSIVSSKQHQLVSSKTAHYLLQSVLHIDSTNTFALFFLARLYAQQHRYYEANDAFKLCIHYDPQNKQYQEEYKKFSKALPEQHKLHITLKNEAAQRKQEWVSNASHFDLPSIISSNDCQYYKVSSVILEQFVIDNNIDAAMFDLNGNRCFCKACHIKRGDLDFYARGSCHKQKYVIPVEYARFGIKLPSKFEPHKMAKKFDYFIIYWCKKSIPNNIIETIYIFLMGKSRSSSILDTWHVVYHGTKAANLKNISESGLILLKPNDFHLNKNGVNKINSRHITRRFHRINQCTGQLELFDPQQIFTSPSCIYASYYSDKVQIGGYKVSFMFQCRQKPHTYGIGQETMDFGKQIIDKHIPNHCVEFYTKENLNIIVTGILIKIHNINTYQVANDRFDEINDDFGWESGMAGISSDIEKGDDAVKRYMVCNGCSGAATYKKYCIKCEGTGKCPNCKGNKIQVSCRKCNGTGLFKNKHICFGCRGSGIYRSFYGCKNCKGIRPTFCGVCEGIGYSFIECEKCNGIGYQIK